MKKLLDLRFVIGIFFAVVGALLLIYDLTTGQNKMMDTSVNIWSAVLFLVFGAGMIVLSYTNKINE
ncbi:hypothetical protein FW778_07750 [Ginsengibacter hankyongi]|uniref:Uncharacterized protein n=1 Tax=Ginsengibacter hankyongi TaxID=2607284 RepID=A0A5J5ILM0_9BACT|nr:hypothetical protein [Ginsengibacter hankyongi]KAA9041899.1 hypothetical protein FW778_07750 [Ginsengibacter hankyongi]